MKIVEVITGLIARIMGGGPDDEQVRQKIPQLFGAVPVIRAARVTVLRELGRDSVSARKVESIRGVNVDALDGASIGLNRP